MSNRMNSQRRLQAGCARTGFTVAELLVALMITSIVLGAVGTLSYAMGRAVESTENMNESQRSIRYATLRISESIRHGRFLSATAGNGIAVWTKDDNGDNQINGSELVYIESVAGAGGMDQLQMVDFPGQTLSVTVGEIISGAARTALISSTDERIAVLAEGCSNSTFSFLSAGFVNITFDIVENGMTTKYQISAKAGASADNLLDGGGELVGGDDD